MEKMVSHATFPDGSLRGDYATVSEVNQRLVGRKIVAVEYVNDSTIQFILDGGIPVSLAPCGTEGDDLELSIESAN